MLIKVLHCLTKNYHPRQENYTLKRKVVKNKKNSFKILTKIVLNYY